MSFDRWIERIQKQVQRPFYFVLLALLSILDSFLFFIPTDGLLVTSVLAHPKAWLKNAIGTAVGSVIGSAIFASIIQVYGVSALHYFAPEIEASATWDYTVKFMNHFGAYALFLIALTPLPQPPIVALSALGNMPIFILTATLSLGRLIKYVTLGRIVSKSPQLLPRLSGIQKEIASAKKISSG